MTLKWNDREFKKALISQLTSNAELVGEYVESEARRRLRAVSDPEWGAKYRRGIVAGLITHDVETDAKGVTIRVGVSTSSESKHHGFYIEMGSSKFPPHPFLRPAVFENGKQIVALLTG